MRRRPRRPTPMHHPPPVDPNAPVPPPPPAPEPGRVDNAAGGFSYVVPAGWKVADATQLSYGQALLNKIPPEGAQPPNDTSVLLGRLDLKLFAGAETDNTKAAQRLASDMGEFFMPFPARASIETVLLNAGGMQGVGSYYEVKFTDTNKPTGQIWAGVVGAPPLPARRGAAHALSDGSWCGLAPPTTRCPRVKPSRWRSRSGRGHHRLRRRRTRTPRHLRRPPLRPDRARMSACRFPSTRTRLPVCCPRPKGQLSVGP